MLTRKNAAIGPVSVLLCCHVMLAQQAPVALNIGVVQGDGAVNYVNHKALKIPVVKVEDSSGRALAGVKVSFHAPDSGPGATFDGSPFYAATTGRDGTVKAAGFTANAQPGPFMVQVVAEYEGQTADRQIPQNNVAPPPAAKGNHRKTALKVAIGCAAVVGFGYILYEQFVAKNKPYGQR